MLDGETTGATGHKRTVYADRAHCTGEREEQLADLGVENQIHEKGNRAAPLTEEQKASNREKPKLRARVEHVFAALAAMGGHLVRTIGLKGAMVKAGLLNLAYNMKRLVQLEALAALRKDRLADGRQWMAVPATA